MGEGKAVVPQRVTSCRINAGKDTTALASGLSAPDGCSYSHTVCDRRRTDTSMLPHVDGSVTREGVCLFDWNQAVSTQARPERFPQA